MPNGHGPQPDLDVTNPGSLGRYLGWMGGVVSDTHDSLDSFKREVREKLNNLDEFKEEIERRDGVRMALDEAKAERRAVWRRRVADGGMVFGAAKWVVLAALGGVAIGGAAAIAVYQFIT